MKKLYRKSTVHPTPAAPPPPPPSLSTRLAFLPAAILTLLASLSEEDKQVLSYFLFCPSASLSTSHTFMKGRGGGGGGGAADHHPPSSSCYCFNCYRSFWARWDSSPDRRIIDEIVEAYEEGLQRKKEKNRKRETRKIGKGSAAVDFNSKDDSGAVPEMPGDSGGGGDGGAAERGSVRRFVGFLGERIWSFWT